jgi:lysophospholipase L1-like esterase
MRFPFTRKSFLARLCLAVLGLAAGLLISEITLRTIDYSYPEFYGVDYSRGYSLRPGIEGWYKKEGKSFVRINSDGLHDVEHSYRKPARTIRIALLGDSYAEAFQVPLENSFWSVMARRLNADLASSGDRVEVINFGVSGYGTAQELITLREQVWKYDPDIVLLAFTTNNDITDNSRLLKKTDRIPYFVYRTGQLELDNSFRNARDFSLRVSRLARMAMWLYDHLRLVQAAAEALKSVRSITGRTTDQLSAAVLLQNTTEPVRHPEEVGIDNLVYRQLSDPTWKDAWRVTEVLLSVMNQEVKNRGVKFIVTTLSNGGQVLPDPQKRAEFMSSMGITDLFYPDLRIKALGEREGFDVITLAPSLQHYAEQSRAYLHGFGSNQGFGHWNITGHRVAGELLANRLYSQIGLLK